jgi:predicted DsbA family dithiol-disulfide isomerase
MTESRFTGRCHHKGLDLLAKMDGVGVFEQLKTSATATSEDGTADVSAVAPPRWLDSNAALQGVELARRAGAFDAYHDAVFRAAFEERLDIGRRKTPMFTELTEL